MVCFFILKSNTVIDHNLKIFINHVEQSIDDINYLKEHGNNIYRRIYEVFVDTKLYIKMIENTLKIFEEIDDMLIPIDKIIEHTFDDMKHVGFDHF